MAEIAPAFGLFQKGLESVSFRFSKKALNRRTHRRMESVTESSAESAVLSSNEERSFVNV